MQKTYPFIRFDELTTGFESPVLVITSYSIHYTKLYDLPVALLQGISPEAASE